jgi:hypothetical protein
MQKVQITDLCGTPPYTAKLCDYTYSYCYPEISGITDVPFYIDVPEELQDTFRLVVQTTDASGCTEFRYVDSITPTPTKTLTPTPTSTPTSECRCIVFTNTSAGDIDVGYTQCDGTPFFGLCPGDSLLYGCGSNPYVTNDKASFNIYGNCVNNSCFDPPLAFIIESTPTVTPTLTVTPTYTPSVTLTQTPTGTITSPTPTKTQTKTPRITTTPTSAPFNAYLFIEPNTGSTVIGEWMYTVNSQKFFGFSNGSQPTQNQSDFNNEMNVYVDFSGWTAGTFPSVIVQSIPSVSGGIDAFGNSIVANNFTTAVVSANTLNGSGWFVWMIPTGATNGLYQSQIDYSLSSPNLLTPLLMESTIYSYTFYYTGSTIPNTTYRVYTTFPGVDFNLSNTGTNIYFRGNSLSS